MRAIALFACISIACAQVPDEVLSRLSEEAEVFGHAASRLLAEETLIQTVILSPRRIHRLELVSEYSLATFGQPPALHELRAVVSVDGHPVRDRGKARRRLIQGITSANDRDRQQMLDELRRYARVDAAVVDLAPLILLFAKRHMEDYRFERAGEGFVGADPVIITRFRQAGGPQSVLLIEKRQAFRQALQGEIHSRNSDGLPLRITMQTGGKRNGHLFQDDFSVDYAMTPHGFLAPLSAAHRARVDGNLAAEHLFRYSRFQQFGASTEIKFTEVPDPK
jgi:hypothetical protein